MHIQTLHIPGHLSNSYKKISAKCIYLTVSQYHNLIPKVLPTNAKKQTEKQTLLPYLSCSTGLFIFFFLWLHRWDFITKKLNTFLSREHGNSQNFVSQPGQIHLSQEKELAWSFSRAVCPRWTFQRTLWMYSQTQVNKAYSKQSSLEQDPKLPN